MCHPWLGRCSEEDLQHPTRPAQQMWHVSAGLLNTNAQEPLLCSHVNLQLVLPGSDHQLITGTASMTRRTQRQRFSSGQLQQSQAAELLKASETSAS